MDYNRRVFRSFVVVSALVALDSSTQTGANAQSLVHRWSFENDYLDTSGSFNDGTASGAPTFTAGKFGQAVSLNSGDDGVHLDFFANNLPLQPTDHWTMNVWLNLATAPAHLEHIAGFSLDNGFLGAADNGRGRSFTSQTVNGNVNYYFWGANADRASGVGYSADSQWHMYTISYNGTNLNMYKDATLVVSAPPTPNAFQQAYDEIHVGNPSQWPPDAFTGIVDEFTIFNGALSDTQIGGLLINNDFTQPVTLNPSFTIDRETREIVLNNDSSFDIDLLGYTIKSPSGSLRPADWDTIAGRFDDAGDGSIDDNDDWEVLTNTSQLFSVELSEGAPGTDGGTIDIGKILNFGPSWAANPVEDITIELLLDDGLGTIKTILAEFVGNDDAPFVTGDFDADGDVDVTDWQHFRTRANASLTGTTATQAYLGGDLDGDDDKDIDDFGRFVTAYDNTNGSGAFQNMLVGVPEPSSMLLVGVTLFGVGSLRRSHSRRLTITLAVIVLSAVSATQASAGLVALYQFNGEATETTGNNIDLSLVGNAGYAASMRAGLGQALSLDGDGDGALGADFVKIQTSNATVVAWVYATSLDGTFDSIVKQWGDVRGQFHFGLGGGTPAGSSNFLQNEYGRTGTASTTLTDATPDAFPTNEWVHVAFTLDSTNGFHRLYINGDVVESAAYPGPGLLGNKVTGANPRGLGIGLKPNTAGTAPSAGAPGYWNGYIDEVGIFDHALSEADIELLISNARNGIQVDGTRAPEPGSIVLLLLAVAMVMFGRSSRSLRAMLFAFVAALVATLTATNGTYAAVNSYYKLNGNANENTGANINLNLLGNAGFTGSVHPGLGFALSLDGDGDGAIGANYTKIQTSDVTAVAWVYATSLDGTWDTIVKQWGDVRGQFHFGLGGGTPAGTGNLLQNEYGRTGTASTVLTSTTPDPFPTNQWVHVAFTLDSVNGRHRLYVNGDVVAEAVYPGPGLLGNKTTGGNPTGLGIGMKPNTAGTGPSAGTPGYWNGFIDEVAIYDHALQEADIEQIIANSQNGIQIDGTSTPFIRLEVDRQSGDVTLINDSPAGVTINAYQISSPSGRLQPGDWDDLAGNAGFPTGNGTGNGWEKDSASNANQLLETFFAGTSNFGNGLDVPLGDIFAGGDEDLEFFYRTADGFVVKSIVEYVGDAGLEGDYNGDQTVDILDYIVWRSTDGGNANGYTMWAENYGNSLGGGASSQLGSAAVPEPGSLLLAVGVLSLFSVGSRRVR